MLGSGICDLHQNSSEIVLCCRLQLKYYENLVFWLKTLSKSSKRGFSIFFIFKFAAQHYFWWISMQIADSASQQSLALVWFLKSLNNKFQGRLGHIYFSAKILPQNGEYRVFQLKSLFKAPIGDFWNCWISKLTALPNLWKGLMHDANFA